MSRIARILTAATAIILIASTVRAQQSRTGFAQRDRPGCGNAPSTDRSERRSRRNEHRGGNRYGGRFAIEAVPVGSYTLVVSYLGYQTSARADVIVKSKRISRVDVNLSPSALSADEVVVEAGYFSRSAEQPVSIVGFSSEEIRRAPGTAGDVSRVIFGLPSVAKVDDTKNSLIVRGGGPIENAFYVDNIAIPNINHFPDQGSTGGPIGILNVDFIREADFMVGGFSTAYGNRLSSVTDISFRNGNRDEIDGQLDMNIAGFGGAIEGPLPNKSGSYLLSARRSFLDLIVSAIDAGGDRHPGI